MNDDEFDLRLRAAIRPLVIEVVPKSVVQDVEAGGSHRPAFRVRMLAAIAVVVAVLFASGYALSGAPRLNGQHPFPSPGSAQSTASIEPSPSPTMTIGCGIFPTELDLCQQAVIVAAGRLPANQQPPLAVALGATQTMSICPPSVSYDPAHPETCAVVAHVTTKSGTVDMVLRLSPTGWMFEFFIMIVCGPLPPDLCDKAVAVAEGTFPATHQPFISVRIQSPSTLTPCPPSGGPTPGSHICDVIVTVTTTGGRVIVGLIRSGVGWIWSNLIR
jgi:hypothetical protein